MTNQELFHNVFEDRGGRLNENGTKQIVNWIRTSFHSIIVAVKRDYPNAPDIVIDILNNRRFGAVTKLDHGKYFIGINHATILILDDIFNRMLCCSNVLNTFADGSYEKPLPKVYNSRVKNLDDLDNISDNETYHRPISDRRKKLMIWLIQSSFEYIVHHEINHVLSGHVSYINTNGKDSLTTLDRQTLEMDSDTMASSRGIGKILALNQNKFYSDFFLNNRNHQLVWSFALNVIWLYSCEGVFDFESISKSSHPPFALRFVYSGMGALARYQKVKGGTGTEYLEEFNSVLTEARNEAIKAFAEISEIGIDRSHLVSLTDLQVNEHDLAILRNWKNLVPKLQPYAHRVLDTTIDV